MDHMLLQLKRSPEQELALQQFLDELQSKSSPNFHHWLSAQEFGERFGLTKSDLDVVIGWLESHGFQVNVVYPSGMLIDFSGTAAQVRKAFLTEVHYLEVKGEKHVGNIFSKLGVSSRGELADRGRLFVGRILITGACSGTPPDSATFGLWRRATP